MNLSRAIEIRTSAVGSAIVSGDGNTVVVVNQVSALASAPVVGTQVNPYRGLAPFYEADADRFFGRNRLVARLWLTLKDITSAAPRDGTIRLLAVLGASGSGKSSVVRAGLVPEFARRPIDGLASPRVASMTPGSQPLRSLAAVLARVATDDPAPLAKAREFEDALTRKTDGAADGLRRVAALMPNVDQSPLLVLVDQFEELFSLCDSAEARATFVETLLDASSVPSGPVTVVITLRADFLGSTNGFPELSAAIAANHELIPVMSEDELRDAIAMPASEAGQPLDPETVDRLVAQSAGRDGALPLLQFALQQIWDAMGDGQPAGETLKRLGGIGGALAGEAQRTYAKLQPADQARARRAFLAMVRIGPEGRDTRRRVTLEQLTASAEEAPAMRRVLDVFADPGRRLVTLSGDDSDEVIAELTHEALIEHWESLRGWLVESREDRRFHQRLNDAAERWRKEGRPNGLLWRSPDLDRLLDHLRRFDSDFTEVERAFTHTALRRRRQGRAAAGAVIVVLVALLGIAEVQRRAVEERNLEVLRSEASLLATLSSDATAGGDATLGTLLALEALPEGASAADAIIEQAMGALYRAQARQREAHVLLGHTAAVTAVAIGPAGDVVATGSKDATARLWDMQTGAEIAVLPHLAPVTSLAFTPDGETLITGSARGVLRFWNAADGTAEGNIEAHPGAVLHLAVSRNGSTLASAAETTGIGIWDIASRHQRLLLSQHQASVWHVDFSADGTRLASASSDGVARVWKLATGEELNAYSGHEGSVYHVRFVDDGGERILTASQDGTMRLWGTGEEVRSLEGHEGAVWNFDLDGGRVVSASADGTARIWDLTTGDVLGTLSGHSNSVVDASFTDAGNRVVTASRDGTVRLWQAGDGFEIARLAGHDGRVRRVAASQRDGTLVSVSADGSARLWRAEDAATPRRAHAHDPTLWSDQNTVDEAGEWALTQRGAATGVALWDLRSGDLIGRLSSDYHSSAIVSPDGRFAGVNGYEDDRFRLFSAKCRCWVDEIESAWGAATAFNMDSTLLALGSDQRLRIFDLVDRPPSLIVDRELPGPIRSLQFDPVAPSVWITTGTDLHYLNFETAVLGTIENGGGHRTLHFSANGEVLLASGFGTDYLYRPSDRTIFVLPVDSRSAGINDAGTRVFVQTGSYTGARRSDSPYTNWRNAPAAQLFDATTGDLVRALDSTSEVFRFEPDGDRLLQLDDAGQAWILDGLTGDRTISLAPVTTEVVDFAFTRDGGRVVGTTLDNEVVLWDAATGRRIAMIYDAPSDWILDRLNRHGERVSWHADDGSLGSVSLFPVDPAALVTGAWADLPRCFSAKEMRRYTIGADPERPCALRAEALRPPASNARPRLAIETPSMSAKVRRLQQALEEHGYEIEVDGRFGTATAAAVRTFQFDAGLSADGVVGPETWQALTGDASGPLLYGSALPRGPAVAALQRLLVSLGYNVEVDAAFGPDTADAVRDFQADNGLAANGVVGSATWHALTAPQSRLRVWSQRVFAMLR